ncbi:hypothetical protein GE061_019736 [Apolygus lucorum]|uniref:Uncharacterized protein n=1 Tax=Apolygus lucorum TaxID=248454 RepID=A0A6A4JQ09_APOLU|nr:hypothetical protein GE061_019736 [Apolygus lucorum]
MAATKVLILALCGLAVVYAHGSSKTLVSKPHQGKFDYAIEHDKHHGSWHGSAHPHGYGGLGDGHGSHGLGGAKVIGALPQGGAGSGSSAGHGHGHGHATSSANFNLLALAHGHH